MIQGVATKALTCHVDDRGFVMEILRADEPLFQRFGQVYVTGCRPGIAKAWHAHREQTDHFACLRGRALVVLYDGREGSPTRGRVQEVRLAAPPGGGPEALLVQIPPLVVHGFTALGEEEALLLNVPTQVYRSEAPDELRLPWDSPHVPYRWPAHVRAGG